jgi:hypothetical protein
MYDKTRQRYENITTTKPIFFNAEAFKCKLTVTKMEGLPFTAALVCIVSETGFIPGLRLGRCLVDGRWSLGDFKSTALRRQQISQRAL